jgi:hypothetical protein
MNIFGLRNLSDDELAERARKQIQTGHRLRWFYLVLSICCFGIATCCLSFGFDWVETFTRGKGVRGVQWHWFLFGLSTGFSFGFFAILLFGKAALFFYFFLDPLLSNRKDALLVQYYDQLRNTNNS